MSSLLASSLPSQVEDLCFTDFNHLRNYWNLLSSRNPEEHDKILNSFVEGNLTLLDKGYSKRKEGGKLYEQAFNLLDEYTWNTCTCSQMTPSLFDPDRYRTTNKPCGKDRYCPRCSFRAEQAFWRKYSPYWSSRLDFYHLTFNNINDYIYFNYSEYSNLYERFHYKLKEVHKKMSNIQSGRTKHTWLLGSIWNEEAACVNLLENKWSSHLHTIIACPRGADVDLTYFDSLGMDIHLNPIVSKSHFDNCLRYFCKPIHGTLREQYRIHWNPSTSRMLYRRVRECMEILQTLFNKRKIDTTGYFRRKLS